MMISSLSLYLVPTAVLGCTLVDNIELTPDGDYTVAFVGNVLSVLLHPFPGDTRAS